MDDGRCGRLIERDDPVVVDHLVADGHEARPLRDVDAAVVEDRQRGAERAAGDAALPHREVLGAVQLRAEQRPFGRRGGAGLARGRHRRHPAIGRIDQQGRLQLRLAPFHPVAGGAGRPAGAVGGHPDDLFLLPFFEGRVLVGGHEEARTVLRRALDRHANHVDAGPDAVQVGIAPRRARNDVAAGLRRHLLGRARRLRVEGNKKGRADEQRGLDRRDDALILSRP